MSIRRRGLHLIACLLGVFASMAAAAASDAISGFVRRGDSILVTGAAGSELRITPYGDHMVRLQTARAGEAHFADDHYETVERHDHGGRLNASKIGNKLMVRMAHPGGPRLEVDLPTLAVAWFLGPASVPMLQESGGLQWTDGAIIRSFRFDDQEHFTGLGHSYFGRSSAIDLKGQETARNYGRAQIDQAPLLVPFYISSKGYGVFLNSTFKNRFNFGNGERYEFAIDTLGFDARMDYFFIAACFRTSNRWRSRT